MFEGRCRAQVIVVGSGRSLHTMSPADVMIRYIAFMSASNEPGIIVQGHGRAVTVHVNARVICDGNNVGEMGRITFKILTYGSG